MSPTVLRSGPYRFFFFSSDGAEPIHVHVGRDDKTAKYWLIPVRLGSSLGFTTTELNKIAALVRDHQDELVRAWHDYFKPGSGHRDR